MRTVLKPGGRIAFTDIVVTEDCSSGQKARLQRDMSMNELLTAAAYRENLERSGFEILVVQDISKEWSEILRKRLEMYRSLKDQTVARFGEAHFATWDSAYSFFVGLYQTAALGGARFCARRKAD